jgi:hypothetical protein
MATMRDEGGRAHLDVGLDREIRNVLDIIQYTRFVVPGYSWKEYHMAGMGPGPFVRLVAWVAFLSG